MSDYGSQKPDPGHFLLPIIIVKLMGRFPRDHIEDKACSKVLSQTKGNLEALYGKQRDKYVTVAKNYLLLL